MESEQNGKIGWKIAQIMVQKTWMKINQKNYVGFALKIFWAYFALRKFCVSVDIIGGNSI